MLWRVPPSNPQFLDVHDVLERIHKAPGSSLRVALRGLPGVGKTQAAIAYAHRHRSDHTATFWVNAETVDTIAADIAAILRGLGLPIPSEVEQLFDAFRSWCDDSAHNGWLLLLDNVTDLDILRRLFPTAGLGRILITTNDHSVGRIVDREIELTSLDRDTGALALLTLAGRLPKDASLALATPVDREAARCLSDELGGLLLALDQAAAFIYDYTTPSDYLKLYQTRRTALLSERGRHRDHADVTITFLLAFERVAEVSPASAELIRLCSVLAPDAIPEELLVGGARDLGDILGPSVDDDISRLRTIEVACRLSLLRYDRDTKTLAIHRLAQVVLHDLMTAELQNLWYLRSIRAVNHAFPEASYSAWPVCERLLPHAKIAARRAEEARYEYDDIGFLLNETAAYLRLRAEFVESRRIHEQSLAFRRATLPPRDPKIAESLNDFGCLYRDLFTPQKALPMFQEALAIIKEGEDQDHEFLGFYLNNLGRAYVEIGDYKNAEPFLNEALAICKQTEGGGSYMRGNVLNNLAELFLGAGDYPRAHDYCAKGMRIREALNNPEKLFRSCSTLGAILFRLGDTAEAEHQFERALRLISEVHGPNHPDFVITLERYAEMLESIGRKCEAEAYFERAFAIRQIHNLMHPCPP